MPSPSRLLSALPLWHPSPKAIDDLHKCIDSAACVHKVMDQDGASTDAFEFYHLTGWFLVDIKDTGGPVMHQETMFRLFTTGG